MIWAKQDMTCPECARTGAMQLLIMGEEPVRYCPFCGCIRQDHSWYKEVSHEEAIEIIETRRPTGLFLEDTGAVACFICGTETRSSASTTAAETLGQRSSRTGWSA